jgi:hypothetical protein
MWYNNNRKREKLLKLERIITMTNFEIMEMLESAFIDACEKLHKRIKTVSNKDLNEIYLPVMAELLDETVEDVVKMAKACGWMK